MITLIDPDLGSLELLARPYAVVSFTIGSPEVRAVTRNRALADGLVDDTRYTGGRAVTVALRLNERYCGPDASNMQELYDAILPFMSPRRRPVLRWSLPGSAAQREMTVRGENAPVVVERAKHPALVLQFLGDGEIRSPEVYCSLIDPTEDTELGRVYDLEFDRSYPPSAGIGDRLITQLGNAPAHWTATIHGPVTDPFIRVNGVEVVWDENSGVTLIAGESLAIDTKARTMYLNGDPSSPRFDRTNFTEWSWDDLLLQPGENTIRFGDSAMVGGSVQFCWRATWAG